MTDLDPHSPDDAVRAAAQRLQDDVAGTVDLDAAFARSQHASRRPAGAVVTVLTVVALLAAVFVLRPDGGDVEIAVDEDEPTTTTEADPDQPDPDIPNGVALGSATDGKDSVGLPVDADPKTGLVDGQTITVTGAQFPPNQSIGVVMCTREAGRDYGGRGADACNIGRFAQGTSDSEGNVSIEFEVRRFATLDGQEIDCAAEPGRCLIGMGMLSDYDQSGGVLVDFDPDVPEPDPPSAELTTTEAIADGETVGISLAGLVPNSPIWMQLCTVDQRGCLALTYDEQVASPDGTYQGDLRLWRQFGTYGTSAPINIDCAVDACHVEVQAEFPGGRALSPIPVSFDPARGNRPVPTMQLVDPGPFAPGDRFDVEVTGVAEGDQIDISLCPPESGECIAYGTNARTVDPTTRIVTVEIAGTPSASAMCAAGCALGAGIYPQTYDQNAPPPLFPDPVTITITR